MSESSLTPAQAPPEKINSFQRIVGALSAPTPTFESIARRPDLLVPMLVMLVISIVSSVLLGQRLDYTSLARQAMENGAQGGQMSPEQIERGVKFTGAIMKAASYAGPFLILLFMVITAGVLLLAFRLMAGEGDFKQALSVVTYAWYPRVIKAVLGLVVLMSKKSMSIFDLQNPLRSNLGFLFNPKTQPLQVALGMSVDAFSIWSLVLLIIGFSAFSKLSRGKSAAIVISLWIVVLLLSLIGPAFQASRMHS